jgi:hypothetical protein
VVWWCCGVVVVVVVSMTIMSYPRRKYVSNIYKRRCVSWSAL